MTLARTYAIYDRVNSTRTISGAALAVAPHALTQRASFLIPVGQVGILMGGEMKIERMSVATTPGRMLCMFVDSGFNFVAEFDIRFTGNNTVGDRQWNQLPSGLVIPGGTTMTMQTSDGSTGGTVDYEVQANLQLVTL